MQMPGHSGLRKLLFAAVINVVFLAGALSLFGQDAGNANDPIAAPRDEKFVEAKDLIVPWRSDSCNKDMVGHDGREANCSDVKYEQYVSSHRVDLYDSDGSVWFRFSLSPREPDYFLDNAKIAFKPFGTSPGRWPDMVALRMTRESPNWYEVEVNEDTRATKYVLKSDPLWSRTTWEIWLSRSYNLWPDLKINKLRDKPNGKVIEEWADLTYNRLTFVKAEGDWALVDGNVGFRGSYKGWIRWRKGRDILVGWIFNDKKPPENKEVR